MKTDELPKIGFRTQLIISANHHVVYVSKLAVTKCCMNPSWGVWARGLWYQLRKSINEQIENAMCKLQFIDNENL